MFVFRLIAALLLGILGGGVNRWRGASTKYKKYLPRPFSQILLSVPFSLYVYYHCTVFTLFGLEFQPWLQASITEVLTTLMILTGYGGWMDLGDNDMNPRKDERTEFGIKWLKRFLNPYWYDAVGMAWNGMLITLPMSIFVPGPMFLIGALKALAYMIGKLLIPVKPKRGKMPEWLDEFTEVGELLSMFFILTALGLIWVL